MLKWGLFELLPLSKYCHVMSPAYSNANIKLTEKKCETMEIFFLLVVKCQIRFTNNLISCPYLFIYLFIF